MRGYSYRYVQYACKLGAGADAAARRFLSGQHREKSQARKQVKPRSVEPNSGSGWDSFFWVFEFLFGLLRLLLLPFEILLALIDGIIDAFSAVFSIFDFQAFASMADARTGSTSYDIVAQSLSCRMNDILVDMLQ